MFLIWKHTWFILLNGLKYSHWNDLCQQVCLNVLFYIVQSLDFILGLHPTFYVSFSEKTSNLSSHMVLKEVE